MSERTSTLVYLIMAGASLAIALWKGMALFRDPTPTLSLITTNFLCSTAIYVMAAPSVYVAIGEATGNPSFATLPVYIGILVCFAHLHVLTLLWSPMQQTSPDALRRRVTQWAACYTMAALLMIATFCAADLSEPADPLKFNTDNAGDPVILLFLAVFLSTLTCSTLSTFRQCRRIRLDDPRLQHAVRSFGIAMLFVFGYVVCGVPAIAFAALGSHALDEVGVWGSSFGVLGTLIASYGLCGAAVSAWLKERRDIRALQPLWDIVVAGVDPELAFSATSARSHRLAANVTFNLHRRVIEILDGMRALRPWVRSEPVEAVYTLHERSLQGDNGPGRPVPERELRAMATAAALRDAAERLQAAQREDALRGGSRRPQPPDTPARQLLGEDTPAADERDRLLHVARVLTHPLVTAALREVRGGGIATARRARKAS
ncbi:MAB_1171c family putative transporter [Streptomyces sp. NPDC127084]|uniref:MAB_1171c family putative transporter n=1 Tax=Streptomyces sp. NPDC127084 TaxID=3347133 RepID=UPI00364A36BE